MTTPKRFLFAVLFLIMGASLCQAEGPKLDSVPKEEPAIDKSGDVVLQKLIKEVAPTFKQFEFVARSGKTMAYNLFTPRDIKKGEKYPLVIFMADATTPGPDVKKPLTQGYGALVWATPEFQAKNPCYVLVPQFSGVAVDDTYQKTEEVDMVAQLIKDFSATNPVDSKRIYATGQSMGGMISMFLNVEYPDLFAASLFVDCHWGMVQAQVLVQHKFIFITAGNKGKSVASVEAIEKACREMGKSYTTASWSAKLPQATQDEVAQTMLDKRAPINLFNFEEGTVLPENGKGSEHMYSFDYAYKLAPVLQWIFEQKL